MYIHQTSKNLLEGTEIDSANSFKKYHPNATYKLWLDNDLKELIKVHYPQIYEIWDNLKGIQKSDLGRYAFLHQYGGIYADTDIFFYNSLEYLNLKEDIYFAPSIPIVPISDENYVRMTNYIIYSKHPKHPFLLDLINDSVNIIKSGVYDKKASYLKIPATTGAVLINETYKKNKDKYTINCFHKDKVINMFCGNTLIPEDIYCIHMGGTTNLNDRTTWNGSIINDLLIHNECKLREFCKIKGNIAQLPIMLIILFFVLLVLFLLYFKYFKSTIFLIGTIISFSLTSYNRNSQGDPVGSLMFVLKDDTCFHIHHWLYTGIFIILFLIYYRGINNMPIYILLIFSFLFGYGLMGFTLFSDKFEFYDKCVIDSVH